MSYNISVWKQKECRLTLDLDKSPSMLRHYGIEIKVIEVDGSHISFTASGVSEGFSMEGTINTASGRGMMTITDIKNYGVGSGSFQLSLNELLKMTTGRMEAVLIWENGDAIQKIVAEDGVVTETQVQL